MYQGLGCGFGKIASSLTNDTSKILTLGDIGSYLWSVPAVKAGVIRFVGGTMISRRNKDVEFHKILHILYGNYN